ncbi:hypothetical protein [Chitinophaga sp. Cy-1792]|uniref:hypothetical protein n=1 Tax=Chitinophaga sp. Cy-1792 TaxID=2608339 RepID=UPI001420A9EA|nr:hypothetical protein [Chitinophaga sp. Cy-1792]NIG56107.1 hypothetical protein [Chitinophaga sp. Cy-1792]
MADTFILISNNDHYGQRMTRNQMQTKLQPEVGPNNHSNLSKALTAIEDRKGKATKPYTFPEGNLQMPVLHASSGKNSGNASITLFWYEKVIGKDREIYIIAVGEHKDAVTYELSFHGQSYGDFKEGKKISLKKSLV